MSKYNIERLGWFNFERLINTLLKQVIGPGVSSFSGSSDQGRDATFEGSTKFPSQETQVGGKWIFQVKYRDFPSRGVNTVRTELKATVKNELDTIILKHRHKVDIYVFITNCPLTANNVQELKKIIEDHVEINHGFVLGAQDIEELLNLHPLVVRTFPQIMGIGQLRELVNWGISQRSIEYLTQVQQDLDTFVVTDPYITALNLLNKQHFCVFTGAPKMGKTCNADAVAAAYAVDGFSVYDIRSQKDFYDVFDYDSKQLFICDDVFGDISLQAEKKDEWTHSLRRMIRALGNNHKLIWTARSYILQEAIENSKILEDRPTFEYDKVVVNVEKLSELEKAMILYNHSKKANLPEKVKEIIKKLCKQIVSSQYFAPETIRQLCTGEIVKFTEDSEKCEDVEKKVFAFLKTPGLSWQKAFKDAPSCVQYICLQMMASGGSVAYKDLAEMYEAEVEEKGLQWFSFADAFAWAEGTFLKRRQGYQEPYIYFYHPSMRDLLTELIQNDKPARQVYINKMSITEFSSLITTIPTPGEHGSQEHKISITDEEDVKLLSDYMKVKVVNEYNPIIIFKILSELLSFIAKYEYSLLPEIGKITLREIASTICHKKFWDANYSISFNVPLTYKRYDDWLHCDHNVIIQCRSDKCETWRDILEVIIFIIKNTPNSYFPEYLSDLLKHFKGSDSVSYWEMVSASKKLSEAITDKHVDYDERQELKEKIENEVESAISNSSEKFNSDCEACKAWHEEYDNVFKEAKRYLEIFNEDEIEDIMELEYLMDEYSDYEEEPDYDRDDFDRDMEASFNIDDIFKDL